MLHLANSDFEFELEREISLPLRQSLEQHPILLQLQFLPFLMEGSNDQVITTHVPPETPWLSLPGGTPESALLDDSTFSNSHLATWGASDAVARWARDHKVIYEAPPREVVAKVHSKVFSFSESPQLPGSQLLHNEEELEEWLGSVEGSAVLKSAFGVSARGHLLIPEGERPVRLSAFCDREWGGRDALSSRSPG